VKLLRLTDRRRNIAKRFPKSFGKIVWVQNFTKTLAFTWTEIYHDAPFRGGGARTIIKPSNVVYYTIEITLAILLTRCLYWLWPLHRGGNGSLMSKTQVNIWLMCIISDCEFVFMRRYNQMDAALLLLLLSSNFYGLAEGRQEYCFTTDFYYYINFFLSFYKVYFWASTTFYPDPHQLIMVINWLISSP